MHFDTSDLKIFAAAAELGSLTAASQRCHLALAAVSKRIARLEEQVGSALFNRSKAGVELTPAGKVFFRHASNWLYDFQTLNAELQEHARGFRGLIRLAANTNAMMGFLPESMGRFLMDNPYVDVRIDEVLSTEVVKRVAERRADIGIFAASVASEHLELFPFRNDWLVLVMAKSHPLSVHTQLSFEQVIGEDFIALDKQAAIQSFLEEQAQRLGKSMHVRVEARSFDAVCRFAQHGFGIGVVPQSALAQFKNDDQLCVIRLADDWAERRLTIAVRSLEALPAYARQLVEHLCETLLQSSVQSSFAVR